MTKKETINLLLVQAEADLLGAFAIMESIPSEIPGGLDYSLREDLETAMECVESAQETMRGLT